MKLASNAVIQIQKPIDVVFEGIVNPEKMTNYFISESNGRLETGNDVLWKFPEFPDRYPVTQVNVITNEVISFVWDPETVVTITLESLQDNSTLVKVHEGEKVFNDANLEWVLENTGGWANFLACLKAYLEYGISLRKGAFDFMIKN